MVIYYISIPTEYRVWNIKYQDFFSILLKYRYF